MKLLIALSLFASVALANGNEKLHRPKSFSANGGQAVFADFSEAHYHITYDVIQNKALVKAEIKLETQEAGFPVFDSFTAPSSVILNGAEVQSIETKTPDNATSLRLINKSTPAGVHTLKIELPLTTLVEFGSGGVKSAFWTSDLTDRKYLERYLPANLEFDQVKMTFTINFIGAKNKQVIYTNGVTSEVSANTFKVVYPSYYTSSSIFFHTVPEGSMNELRYTLKSLDGREIPVVLYAAKSPFGSNLERLKNKTTEIFHELEGDYGAFPHPSITAYFAGSGGMEYCGATMTSESALGHELFHSYFARGVMPANGNAGWVDEALASWRDEGYQTLSSLSGSSGMSAHAYYTRTTDRAAYSFGERFMSYMDGKLKSKGGLKPFMRYMVDKKVFRPFVVDEFIQEMSDFYGVPVAEDFKKYTFGKGNNFSVDMKSKSHIHRKMSLEEMQNYL